MTYRFLLILIILFLKVGNLLSQNGNNWEYAKIEIDKTLENKDKVLKFIDFHSAINTSIIHSEIYHNLFSAMVAQIVSFHENYEENLVYELKLIAQERIKRELISLEKKGRIDGIQYSNTQAMLLNFYATNMNLFGDEAVELAPSESKLQVKYMAMSLMQGLENSLNSKSASVVMEESMARIQKQREANLRLQRLKEQYKLTNITTWQKMSIALGILNRREDYKGSIALFYNNKNTIVEEDKSNFEVSVKAVAEAYNALGLKAKSEEVEIFAFLQEMQKHQKGDGNYDTYGILLETYLKSRNYQSIMDAISTNAIIKNSEEVKVLAERLGVTYSISYQMDTDQTISMIDDLMNDLINMGQLLDDEGMFNGFLDEAGQFDSENLIRPYLAYSDSLMEVARKQMNKSTPEKILFSLEYQLKEYKRYAWVDISIIDGLKLIQSQTDTEGIPIADILFQVDSFFIANKTISESQLSSLKQELTENYIEWEQNILKYYSKAKFGYETLARRMGKDTIITKEAYITESFKDYEPFESLFNEWGNLKYLPALEIFIPQYRYAVQSNLIDKYPTDLNSGYIARSRVYHRQLQLNISKDIFEAKAGDPFISDMYHLDIDDILNSKSVDYRSKVFISEILDVANNDNLRKNYSSIARKKALLGQIHQLNDEQQMSFGYTPQSLKDSINSIRDLEKSLFVQLMKLADFNAFAESRKISWEKIKRNLKKGEAFVDIERIENVQNSKEVSYMVFIIRVDKDPIYLVLNDKRLDEAKFLKFDRTRLASPPSIKSGAPIDYEDTRPYEAFWSPLEKFLKGVNEIYISPDGVYHQISFEGLYGGEEKGYLADHYKFIRVVDVLDLNNYFFGDKNQDSNSLENVNIFSYPNYSGKSSKKDKDIKNKQRLYISQEPLASLPGTREESEAIESILKNRNISFKSFIMDKASEEQIKSIENPSVLHIATHGFFMPSKKNNNLSYSEQKFIDNPLLRNGLYLANADISLSGIVSQGEDGILSAEEMNYLPLKGTELVVLSACETGLGEILNGEGVYGMQRSLLLGGVKSLIMSLWQVSDESTKEFMITFYNYWLSEGMSKRIAFDAAQKDIRIKYRHPYYWAPFVFIGE